MASKSDILKRIQASKKGEPTFQDKNRLKTWKDAKQGSRAQEHGYNRALRNMQRSAQQGQEFNKVDAQIVSSYVKETPEQLLSKSKTFMNLATWLPAGGAVAKLGATAIKAASKAAAPTAKAAAPKVAKAAAPKVAKATAAAKKALKTAQRKAQRARLKARTDVLGDMTKGGMHTKGLAQAADKAGKRAYNKVMKQHAKDVAPKVAKTVASKVAKVVPRGPVAAKVAAQTTKEAVKKVKSGPPGRVKKVASEVVGRTTKGRRSGKALRTKTGQLHGLKPKDIRLAQGIRTGGAAVGIPAAAIGTAIALKDDKKTDTPPRPKRKPGGAEVYFERARREREEAKDKADDEKKAITRSRAGRDTGIGAGRESEQELQNIVRDLAHQDPTGKYYPSRGTRRALKPLEGGVRYVNLPDWLGGGRIKMDTSDKAFNYEDSEHKKGGQIKKGVKKAKAKPRKAKAKTRKRAALRGHRAELRGG